MQSVIEKRKVANKYPSSEVHTSHNESDRWWRQGVLGSEVGRRHLALPFAVVKFKGGSSDPETAVPGILDARPLVLLVVNPNWLQQKAIVR